MLYSVFIFIFLNMYEIDLTRPAEDVSDESLKEVLRDAELSEFYHGLKDEGCNVKELYELNYREFVFCLLSKYVKQIQT